MMDSNEKMHSKAQNEEKVSEKKSENAVESNQDDQPVVEKKDETQTVKTEEPVNPGVEEPEKPIAENVSGSVETSEEVIDQPSDEPGESPDTEVVEKPVDITDEEPTDEKPAESSEITSDEVKAEIEETPVDVVEEKVQAVEVETEDEEKKAEVIERKEEPERDENPEGSRADDSSGKTEETEAVGEPDEETINESSDEPVEDVSSDDEEISVEEDEEDNDEEKEVEKPVRTDEPQIDYSTYSEVELVNAFREQLEKDDFVSALPTIDAIKISFYKKHKVKLQEQKKKFLDEGGMEEEFKAEVDPYELDMKALMQQVRQKKSEFNKDLEAEKDENLKLKYEIIEEIKNLINRKESINKTFQEFRDLQQKWRDIGLVPQVNMKDLWENYHHHVENFYDYIKINKELRDLDLKKNMEEKIALCEKAEALLLEPSVLKSFNTLQKYHDLWREIGPVPRDKKEEIWERFRAATTLINKKHQDFFENRKKAQKKNLEAKTALCEKVEEILDLDLKSHKEWEDKSKELIELQKYWRTIGFAPKKDNNAIYERFRNNCDKFFDNKREFYSKHKEIQNNNLQFKIDLCVQAEALKDSTDWKKTTDEFISIQKKWKEIGPVPRKQSDAVWKRFRAACDYFFKQKSEFFNSKDETQVENLKLKNELIDEVINFKSSGNDEKDFEIIREYQRRWNEIGFVPIGDKNNIQRKFRDAINIQFDKLRVEDKDRNLLKFRNKVTDWKGSSRGQNKMLAERDKYITKLKHLENDLITLKNNIGFFADSKNAEALIKDVERKIARNEEQIVYLKDKIRVIDAIDSSDDEN